MNILDQLSAAEKAARESGAPAIHAAMLYEAYRPSYRPRRSRTEGRGVSEVGRGVTNMIWRTRKFLRSVNNWRRGFAFGYVSRCRVCCHTAYRPEHALHAALSVYAEPRAEA